MKKQLSEHDKELNAAVEKIKEEYEQKIKDLQSQLNDKEEKQKEVMFKKRMWTYEAPTDFRRWYCVCWGRFWQ